MTTPGSSSGRITPFDGADLGSNPSPGTMSPNPHDSKTCTEMEAYGAL